MSVRDLMFRGRLPLLNRALDTYTLRQKTIAQNIANATTPNYRPERVRFEEEFQRLQGVVAEGNRTSDRHIPLGAPNPGSIEGTEEDAMIPKPEVFFSGESHVNVDKEMSALAENQIRFRFASRMTARYFRGMQSAIKGMNE